ncbi:phage portal protein [Kosmotoga pacifica]|uniref:phage portal protein n=1 Tax=Kosmotoga pacifica TaxID=1330330 RepID=UPI0009E1F198|nr:phage portal protein [Kosmotoga pacifica]
MAKNYYRLWDLFYGDYDRQYCEKNQLFIDTDKQGRVKHMTKSLVDYAFEIISTDLSLIFGKGIELYDPDNEANTQRLEKILKFNNFDTLSKLMTLQGLILGDTAAKVGRDDNGKIRIGLVNFLNGDVEYVKQYGEIVAWIYKYQMPHENGTIKVREVYTRDRVQIFYDEKTVIDVPNRYGEFWFVFAPNIPSINYDVWGESELERIGDTIDEMNSILSRITAIADVYAKPRIIAKNLADPGSLKREDNIWAVNAEDIRILEYSGNVIPSLLQTYDRLENYLRNKCPELILNDLGNISGYALKLKLSKLIRKIENYRDVYFEAFKKIARLALMMDGVENPNIEIKAGPVIPADEVEDLNRWIQLISMNLVSKETAAQALGIDWEAEQEKINKEIEMLAARFMGGENDVSGDTGAI